MRAIPAFIAIGAALVPGCGGGGSPAAPAASDGGSDAPASLACPPAALGSWQPSAYHHANTVQSACTSALIADFYASCLGPTASAATCDPTWGSNQDAVHQACETCLVTPVSAATWGAVVQFGTTVSLNVGGCIELLDKGPGGLACATSVQQADGCEHKACDATCPVTDDASFANWKGCVSASASATGVCASYTAAAACARGELDAGAAARCINAQTFQDQFVAIGEVFCAP
jgi:hypothetical protein